MSQLFAKHDTQDLNRKSALDILEKLKPLRQGIKKEFVARRLIWELIQNAKDNVAVCNPISDQSLKIEINLTQDKFTFSHNKGYFQNENIRGLIRRYSSSDKDREENDLEQAPPTTGRFGTGFMTTHLLSEIVDVKGVFQTESGIYKNLHLHLDRTGQNITQLIGGIEKAFDSVEESVVSSASISKPIEEFRTEFIYHLDKEGFELSSISIEELKSTAAYSLIRYPNITEIKCVTPTEELKFSIQKIDEIKSGDVEITFYQLHFKEDCNKQYVSVRKDGTVIIFPIRMEEGKCYLLPVEADVPKFFLDFPMIGTEDFNIPFIINSSFFEPTEARDGISLTGGDDKDTLINSSILTVAFGLFKAFIDFVATKGEWKQLYNTAKLKKPKEKDWLDHKWYEKNFIEPTRKYLLTATLVEPVEGKRLSILNAENKPNVWFPSSHDETVRERIWKLANKWIPHLLPCFDHIHEWYDLIWKDCSELSLQVITNSIQGMKDLKGIKDQLKQGADEIDWLNDYYDVLNIEGKFIDEIIKDKYAVIPNQKNELKKRKDLLLDEDIDEELKNVLELLNVTIRPLLVHKTVNTGSMILYTPKKQDTVIDQINKIIKEGKNPAIAQACNYLISCFDKEPTEGRIKIYDFSKKVFTSEISDKKQLTTSISTIWEEADKYQLKRIAQYITAQGTVAKLQTTLAYLNEEETLKWLDAFATFLSRHGHDNIITLKVVSILPNQNGVLKHKDNLFIDNIEKEADDLKDISGLLGYDIKDELLHQKIFPVIPEAQNKKLDVLAFEIDKRVTERLSQRPRSEVTTKVFNKLLVWINNNRGLAENHFQYLSKNKHLLYDDDEIASNIEKANVLDIIMEETGLSAYEIKERLIGILRKEDDQQTDDNEVQRRLPKSVGSLYPQGSEEDIMMSPSLTDNSSEASRISISQDAKETIFSELRAKGFTVPSTLDINYTVVEGIDNPTGKPIKLVVKSAKAGRIYFNPTEWLALAEPDTQLFAVTRGNKVRNITLSDLENFNEIFHMRFNTSSFTVNTNLVAFANFFRYLKYTHFIFEAPESTTDFLQGFGLDKRNSSASDLTADDKNLLH